MLRQLCQWTTANTRNVTTSKDSTFSKRQNGAKFTKQVKKGVVGGVLFILGYEDAENDVQEAENDRLQAHHNAPFSLLLSLSLDLSLSYRVSAALADVLPHDASVTTTTRRVNVLVMMMDDDDNG